MSLPLLTQKKLYGGNPATKIIYINGDHTLRELVFTAKIDRNPSSSVILEKKNDVAGGSVSEILAEYLETTLPYRTRITVYFTADDTNITVWNSLQFDLTSTDADDEDDVVTVATGRIVREQNVNVTPVGGEFIVPNLTLSKYAHWSYEEGVDSQPVAKSMQGWANNPVATVVGDTITIASAGAEIPGSANFDSSFKDYDTGTWDSSTRVIYFGDLTGKTIEFWLEYYE
jgi:hypothetical protein